MFLWDNVAFTTVIAVNSKFDAVEVFGSRRTLKVLSIIPLSALVTYFLATQIATTSLTATCLITVNTTISRRELQLAKDFYRSQQNIEGLFDERLAI